MPEPERISDADLAEIEDLARTNAAETYCGALLALAAEARRLRGLVPVHDGVRTAKRTG